MSGDNRPSRKRIIGAAVLAVLTGMCAMAFFLVLAMLHTATGIGDVVVGGIGVVLLAPLMALYLFPDAVFIALLLCLVATWLLSHATERSPKAQRLIALGLALPIGMALGAMMFEDWGTLVAKEAAIAAALWLPASAAAMLTARFILFSAGRRGYRG